MLQVKANSGVFGSWISWFFRYKDTHENIVIIFVLLHKPASHKEKTSVSNVINVNKLQIYTNSGKTSSNEDVNI
jgi:hypothetical protein